MTERELVFAEVVTSNYVDSVGSVRFTMERFENWAEKKAHVRRVEMNDWSSGCALIECERLRKVKNHRRGN